MGFLSNGVPCVPVPPEFVLEAASWSPAEFHVALVLLVCPDRLGIGREGLLPLDAAGVSRLLNGWPIERVSAALDGLEERRWLVQADGWIFVPSVMRYDQPRRGNEARGAAKRLQLAPRHSMVWFEFLQTAGEVAAPLHEEIVADSERRPLSKGLAKGLTKPLRTGALEADGQDLPHPVPHPRDLPSPLGSPLPSPFRDEGAPERVRDTTSNPGDGVVGRLASSSAEPHGNAPGGNARTTDPANGQDGTA